MVAGDVVGCAVFQGEGKCPVVMQEVKSCPRCQTQVIGACFIRMVSIVCSPGALFFIFFKCSSFVVTGFVRGWCSVM